jgi:hypothetical protein
MSMIRALATWLGLTFLTCLVVAWPVLLLGDAIYEHDLLTWHLLPDLFSAVLLALLLAVLCAPFVLIWPVIARYFPSFESSPRTFVLAWFLFVLTGQLIYLVATNWATPRPAALLSGLFIASVSVLPRLLAPSLRARRFTF